MPDEPNKKDQDKSWKPKLGYSSIWLIIVAVAAAALFYHFLTLEDQKMLYSEFKNHLREGRVARVFIGEKTITGELKLKNSDKKPLTFTTVTVDDPELVSELEGNHVQFSGKESSAWISGLMGWVFPVLIIAVVLVLVLRRVGPSGSIMSFGKSRAKFYEEDETRVTFNEVAGIDEAKEELIEIIEFLKNPGKFTSLGGKIPKGALIVGAPGTGKTLLAKAVAGEAKVPFFSISGSAFVEMFVGVGASRVRDLFNQAQNKAPCIIFI